MSLQQIMDATPIVSWRSRHPNEFGGSGNNYTYLICKHPRIIELWWDHKTFEEVKRLFSNNTQEIIDKINELEEA